jgi:hypothetical protein
MKRLTLFPMASYPNKILGLVITTVGIISLAVFAIHGPIEYISHPAGGRQFNLFLTILLFGMYLTAFSKEKNDDERVQAIRAKALQMAFGLLTGTMAAFSMASSLANVPMDADINVISCVAIFGLAIYLAVFHIGLYFDPAWTYNDDTVLVNIRKNKKFFVIYFSILIILAILVFILRKR